MDHTLKHHELRVAGETKSGKTSIHALGITCGGARTIIADVHVGARRYHHTVFSPGDDSILIHAREADRGRTAFLSEISNPRHIQLTARQDQQAAQTFRIDVPTIVKTQALADSVSNGGVKELDRILGTQPFHAVMDEFGPLIEREKKVFDEFIRATKPDNGDTPCAIPGWCIAIYCVPILGIAGLLIPRCRG